MDGEKERKKLWERGMDTGEGVALAMVHLECSSNHVMLVRERRAGSC